MVNCKRIWMNGNFVDHDEAKVHVLTHALHYGSSFFEGIRAYETPQGTAVFRLDEHIERLYDSCKIYRVPVPYSREELKSVIMETLKENELKSAYIRPLIYRGYNVLGLNPHPCPVDVMVAAWEWGAYLGDDSIEKGISAMTSSWRRLAPDTMPTLAKAGGNYLSSQLIKMEAMENGYDEGIALDFNGYVSEGSAENIFVIKNGVIYTPTVASSALLGITRNSVIDLAKSLGYEVREMAIPREFLYVADEIFVTGTAVEVTPLASLDGIEIGNGDRPITKAVQKIFYDTVKGINIFNPNWLTYVK